MKADGDTETSKKRDQERDTQGGREGGVETRVWDSEQAEEAQRGQGGVGAAPEGGVTQDPSRFSLMCCLTFHFTSCPLTSGSLGNQRRQAQVPQVRLAL